MLRRGFTLIEALIAVFISMLLAVFVASMVTTFSLNVPHKLLLTCLTESAASAMEACEAGEVITSLECGDFTINLTVEGNCTPGPNSCSDVTVTSSFDSMSYSLSGKVCNFN